MNTIIKKILNSKILSSTILVWILSSIDILLVISVLIIDSRFPKYLFGADNPKANGDFLTICFSVIGGGAVIYGLYLNNKRIKEQTRQNDIAMKQADIAANNNNDKRFGDAVGYLGSDNTSIVLGGIHTLHQLAKEDERYVPIVANMYTGYLKDKSESLYLVTKHPVVIRTIINILFSKSSVFKDEFIDLSNTTLKNMQFNVPVINCSFNKTDLFNCTFNFGISSCTFLLSRVVKCKFKKDLIKCKFKGELNKCKFNLESMTKCSFSIPLAMESCDFSTGSIENVIFTGKNINNTTFELDHTTDCQFIVTAINDSYFACSNTVSMEFIKTNFTNTTFDENLCMEFRNCINTPTARF